MDRDAFNRLLDALGLQSCFLVDIGARDGIDHRWRLLGDRLFVVGFEADQEECTRLASSVDETKYVFLPTALAGTPGRTQLHTCRDRGKSSCYLPNRVFLDRFPRAERFDLLRSEELVVDTLDHVLDSREGRKADFIKLDVQGSERDILEGARKTAGDAFGIEVEVEFSELYKGQPLFSDVDVMLRELGFTLFDLRPAYWKRTERPCKGVGQVVFADGLYLKDPIAADRLPHNPAAGIAICVLYQKFDFALELAQFFFQKKVYSSEEYERARGSLLSLSTPRLPWGKIRGSLGLANVLESLVGELRSAVWHRSYDNWKL